MENDRCSRRGTGRWFAGTVLPVVAMAASDGCEPVLQSCRGVAGEAPAVTQFAELIARAQVDDDKHRQDPIVVYRGRFLYCRESQLANALIRLLEKLTALLLERASEAPHSADRYELLGAIAFSKEPVRYGLKRDPAGRSISAAATGIGAMGRWRFPFGKNSKNPYAKGTSLTPKHNDVHNTRQNTFQGLLICPYAA